MSRLAIAISFCLFYIASASASPEMSAPSPALEPPQKSETPIDENLSVAPPPQVTARPKVSARYYPYRETLTAHFGLSTNSRALYGFDYMFPSFLSPHWEAGADYSSSMGGHVHVGARWTLHQRDFLRYSFGAALDNRFDSGDGMATIIKIENFFARVSGALEYTFADPISLRLEYNFYLGVANAYHVATLGLSYAW